jgi:hypothetical protein
VSLVGKRTLAKTPVPNVPAPPLPTAMTKLGLPRRPSVTALTAGQQSAPSGAPMAVAQPVAPVLHAYAHGRQPLRLMQEQNRKKAEQGGCTTSKATHNAAALHGAVIKLLLVLPRLSVRKLAGVDPADDSVDASRVLGCALHVCQSRWDVGTIYSALRAWTRFELWLRENAHMRTHARTHARLRIVAIMAQQKDSFRPLQQLVGDIESLPRTCEGYSELLKYDPSCERIGALLRGGGGGSRCL